MAKAKKKKQFVPLFEDYFDQFNLLSFDQAGRLFALIRSYCNMDPEQFLVLESSIALENGAKIIWSFLKSDLDSWYEEKQKKSETNAANARSRWKSAAATAPSPCSVDVPGQKSIIFTAEQDAPGDEPVLTAHAAGMNSMRNDANGMRKGAVASENDAIASPIYNINNNTNIHSNNIDIPCPDETSEEIHDTAVPTLETIIQLFTDNGSTKSEAQKYFNYYRMRNWMTAKGELITDVEESVKRWIARNARFWSRKSGRSSGISGYKPAANKQRTQNVQNVQPVNADQSRKVHTAAVASTPYWDGTCSCPSNVKPGSFRDFEQRNYDYNALQKMLSGCAM